MNQSYLQQLSELKGQVKVESLDSQTLRIEQTIKGPFVFLNSKEGIIVMSGKSVLENVDDFYRPIMEFISDHFLNTSKIQVYIRPDYCNSSTSKYYLKLVLQLDKLYIKGKEVNVYWFQHEDEYDSYSDGYDYQSFVKYLFDVIELNDADIKELDNFLSRL